MNETLSKRVVQQPDIIQDTGINWTAIRRTSDFVRRSLTDLRENGGTRFKRRKDRHTKPTLIFQRDPEKEKAMKKTIQKREKLGQTELKEELSRVNEDQWVSPHMYPSLSDLMY